MNGQEENTAGINYGCIHVSGKDQNEARQVPAMHAFEIQGRELYVDKVSGKDFDRLQHKRLIRALKSGNALIIMSIGRLGRNYQEIPEQ